MTASRTMHGRTAFSPWPSLLCAPLGMLAAGLLYGVLRLPGAIETFLAAHSALRGAFIEDGFPGLTGAVSRCGLVAAAICLVASLAGFVRRPWALRIVRAAYMAGWILGGLYVYAVFCATALPLTHNIAVNGVTPTPGVQFFWRLHLMAPAFAVAFVLALLYLFSWRSVVLAVYSGQDAVAMPPAAGDRLLENLRTHGDDPRFRKGIWSSAGIHLLVIVVIPWLLSMRGCVDPYRVPKGSGTPEVAAEKIIKVVKKKKKHLLVNAQSAISFYVPDLDDSKILRQVDQETQMTYQADPNRMMSTLGGARAGKMGVGGGKEGGWPDGMDNAMVRFIRMEYNGSGWDDGMDAASRADLNFLDAFHQLTGFKVATRPESHSIGLLRKYPKGFAPPFVFITGDGDINVTAGDIKAMRDYLLDGGLLFASCGSPRWNASFHAFAQQLFPGEALLVIADDDSLFQVPYAFPNGAPPLWHHGGYRALGIKHNGRWVVFYHPGAICDAWKTGHSGMDPALAEGATQVGVNVIYYAFTHYLEMTRKYRQ